MSMTTLLPLTDSRRPRPPRGTRSGRRLRPALIAGLAGALAVSLAAPAQASVDPFPPPVTPTSPPGSYSQQVLASNGDNGIDPVLGRYYRIVGLADLGNGVLLASYDGRPDGGDSPSPNSIVQRRSTDSGKTWGAPTFIARGQVAGTGDDGLRYGFSDPSYVVDRTTGTVFNFHVYSKDQGFVGSVLGNDDSNRQVMSTEVSVSTDGGRSWSTDPASQPTLPTPQSYPADSPYAGFDGPLITDVVKPVGSTVNGVANVGGVVGGFASSGEGIQLRYGPHAGRLIQQFAATIVQPDGSTAIQAYSVYSDNHGASWTMGTPVGTGMDENKVVELSDGRVMLNARDHNGSHGRKIAISTDGGATYGPVTVDPTLVDPTNNAGITRMYPTAPEGSADAKKLLFSNANSASSRTNGTIRYSCDDGASWGSSRQFKAGAMSYSTVTALGDGTFGLLYEGDGNTITFAKFDAAWLSPLCAAMTAAPTSVPAGNSAPVAVTIANNDDVELAAGTLELADRIDWDAPGVAVPAIAPGDSATVQMQVSAPGYVKDGSTSLGAVYRTGTATLTAPIAVTVTGGATTSIVGAAIFGQRNDDGRDLAENPYAAGDAVPYKFRVYHTGNIAEVVTPGVGNFTPFTPPGPGNCRYLVFNVGADYLCNTPKHPVTEAEAAAGFFVPVTNWQVTGTGATTKDYRITGDEVDLTVRAPGISVAVAAGEPTDTDGDGYPEVGDTITFTTTVSNSGNVSLTDVTGVTGDSATELAVGESASGTTIHPLSAAEVAAHEVAPFTASVTARNGSRQVAGEATTPSVALPALPDEADLAVTVDSPDRVARGEVYSYTVTVRNSGPAPASGVVTTLALSAGTTVESTTGAPRRSGRAISWTSEGIDDGDSISFTIQVRASDSAGVRRLVATTDSARTPDPQTADNIVRLATRVG